MWNRRKILGTLGGVAIAGLPAFAEKIPKKTRDVWGEEDVPNAKVIHGHPNILDFGDDLKIPLNQEAFLTLWEGKTFWMTYGVGQAERSYQSSGLAIKAAEGTMQLLLLTLAFAPERLNHSNGGWRLKDQNVKNYVRGTLILPGKPFSPLGDSRFGNMDTATPSTALPTTSLGQSTIGIAPILPQDMMNGLNEAVAFTCYIVKKKDVDLAYVRKFAQLVPEDEQRRRAPETR